MYVRRAAIINDKRIEEIVRAGEKICYINGKIQDKTYDEILKEERNK